MKIFTKLLILFIYVLTTIKANAQEKFSTYDNTVSDKTYNIDIISEAPDKFTLYIDAMSFDKLHTKGGITIDHNQHHKFFDAILQAKEKYQEWVKTAKENDVKDLSKTMTIKTKAGGYFKYGSKWQLQFRVTLKFDFRIIESKGEIKYLLLIKTGELQSSTNQYMKMDGFALVFSSTEEMDEFTESISKKKITEFLNTPKKEDLFKN